MARRKFAADSPSPKAKKPVAASVPVENLTQVGDKRNNVTTRESAGFTRDEQPKKVLYPRNPSLGPQLVWKVKQEQDQHPLAVPAVSTFVLEKIPPAPPSKT